MISPPTVDPVIAARDLSKRYGPLLAVDGASFEVQRGEIFGLLGPNGAGKTTTVEMLEGLTVPSSGTAEVLGFDIVQQPDAVKTRIGVQLQASSYHRYLTLREILQLFGSFYPRAASPDDLLERVGLSDRADARIEHLSGGLQQRFSIVAAMVNEPELVFFDEPTAGLDPDARRQLWTLVRDVRDEGRTVVMTTHYMEEAELLCDRVAFMDSGRIAALDTPQALIRTLHAPYRVRLTTTEPLDPRAVEGIEGASAVECAHEADGFVTRLRAQHAPGAAAALTALADGLGVTAVDLAVEPATLEDVFLAVTGRGLED
ncbi:MAG: ATP-binding cassette domain-containing protein [Dehalococcoidia bacterium]|nr:ATP-binding cassette domain-containing protein [Dehalococcoidia bacterium]